MKISRVKNCFSALDQVMAKDFELITILGFTANQDQIAVGEYASQPNLAALSKATKKYQINKHFDSAPSKKLSDKKLNDLNNALTQAV